MILISRRRLASNSHLGQIRTATPLAKGFSELMMNTSRLARVEHNSSCQVSARARGFCFPIGCFALKPRKLFFAMGFETREHHSSFSVVYHADIFNNFFRCVFWGLGSPSANSNVREGFVSETQPYFSRVADRPLQGI